MSQREREKERENGLEGGRAQDYLPQPIKPASLGDRAKSTAGPCVMSECQQPVAVAEGRPVKRSAD